MSAQEQAKKAILDWQADCKANPYQADPDFKHAVNKYLAAKCPSIDQELTAFAEKVVQELEPLVIENNLPQNLPRLHQNVIVHHPAYEAAGNIIYGSRLLERMAKPGGLLEALAFMFLASQAGEAGHNCPIACSAGLIRVMQKVADIPRRDFFLQKLTDPSYSTNFTGAQFLTEIQGGSDVGQNEVEAFQDEYDRWRLKGEKWFCSNADSELMLVTARFDPKIRGTKGLGLFLVPSFLESGERNHYRFLRLKEKIGTQSMATAEIAFEDALAIPVGPAQEGFKLVMENVLHISRLFNTICVLGMARRAYFLALNYAKHRIAFGHPIIHYPLVQENLARIKAENDALLASIFAVIQLQDDFDRGKMKSEETKLLLRLLANLNKHLSALWSVEHIHHALDVLAGNGAIESFSTIPRLLRDSIVCENWEGTHHTLRMQILKDIERYHVDELLLAHLEGTLLKGNLSERTFALLQSRLSVFKALLRRFKTAGVEERSLQIQTIVNQMGILFAAIHLACEATDQRSKQHSFDYFASQHLEEKDQNPLELIKKITQNSG